MADFSFLNTGAGPDVDDDEQDAADAFQGQQAKDQWESTAPMRAQATKQQQQTDSIGRLKKIQNGLVDIYDTRRPLLSAERLDPSFNLQDLKKMDPVGFFNTYGRRMAKESFMQDVDQLPEKMQEAESIMKGLNPQAPPAATPQQQKMQALPNAYTPAEKATGQIGAPEVPKEQQEGIVDPIVNMDHAFTAAGLPRREAIQSLTEMRRFVEMEGISTSAAVSPLSFIPTYTNLISHIFNPQVAHQMLSEMAPKEQEQPQQQPQGAGREPQQSTFGSDKLEQDPRFQHNQQMIQQKEDRHAQVIQELANSGTFKNVGDVLGFVLTSFLLGPRVAGLFFSNMEKNGRLRDELNILDHETTGLYHQQNSYIQLAQHARQMAASEDHQKATEAENARHHWAVENYMRTKRGAEGLTGEDKSTHMAIQQSMRQHYQDVKDQESKVKMMEKAVSNPLDPDFKNVSGALSGERRKLIQMKKDYRDWVNGTIAPWYAKRGIELAKPGGTDLNDKTFESPTE